MRAACNNQSLKTGLTKAFNEWQVSMEEYAIALTGSRVRKSDANTVY